jgi:hypothetical protein
VTVTIRNTEHCTVTNHKLDVKAELFCIYAKEDFSYKLVTFKTF